MIFQENFVLTCLIVIILPCLIVVILLATFVLEYYLIFKKILPSDVMYKRGCEAILLDLIKKIKELCKKTEKKMLQKFKNKNLENGSSEIDSFHQNDKKLQKHFIHNHSWNENELIERCNANDLFLDTLEYVDTINELSEVESENEI